jgi:hypothetical protein
MVEGDRVSKDLSVKQEKFTDSERKFLTEVDRYKESSGKRFPTLVELFRLARQVMGLEDEHERKKTNERKRK